MTWNLFGFVCTKDLKNIIGYSSLYICKMFTAKPKFLCLPKKRIKVHDNGYLSEACKYKYTKSNTKQKVSF